MLQDSTAEDNLLEILALIDERLWRILVGNADDILLDDRTSIEVFGNIMACRANDLDSPLESLMIWLGSHECRQEGMMDVDDIVRIFGNHLWRDDLHILGEHNEIHAKFIEKFHLLWLKFVPIVLVEREAIVRYAEALGNWAEVLMIADDAWDIHIPFARGITCKDIEEAMVLLADKKCHLRFDIAEVQTELHRELVCEQSAEIILDLVAWNEEAVELPFKAHEKNTVDSIYILVCIDNVSVVY